MRRLVILCAAGMITACASTPTPLKGSFTAVTPLAIEGAGAAQASGRVRWGGSIVETIPEKDRTCFIVVAHPLDKTGRPENGDKTLGRFIACANGFYEPEVYARRRRITVVGRLAGVETKDVGGYSYRYPKVEADTVYLWSKQMQADYPIYQFYPSPYSFYYPYSYYPFGGSLFYGSLYGGPLYGRGFFPYSFGLPPLNYGGRNPLPRMRRQPSPRR